MAKKGPPSESRNTMTKLQRCNFPFKSVFPINASLSSASVESGGKEMRRRNNENGTYPVESSGSRSSTVASSACCCPPCLIHHFTVCKSHSPWAHAISTPFAPYPKAVVESGYFLHLLITPLGSCSSLSLTHGFSGKVLALEPCVHAV